jgi:hypothetical protein
MQQNTAPKFHVLIAKLTIFGKITKCPPDSSLLCQFSETVDTAVISQITMPGKSRCAKQFSKIQEDIETSNRKIFGSGPTE